MKSEERHQLLTNDLSVVTTKTASFLERHLVSAIAIVCAVLIIGGIGFLWTQTTDSSVAEGWTMLDTSNSIEDFGMVVDKFKGKPPAHWAQLEISERTLQTAEPLMFSNREIAVTDLKRAREGFESLLQDKSIVPAIRERALWGLALCLETGCEGDTSKPVEAYQRLIKDFPDTVFKAVAEDRIAALNRGGAGEFYAWFSKENPKPPEARPMDFKPGSNVRTDSPDFDDNPNDFESPHDKSKKPVPGDQNKEATEAAEKSNDDKPNDPVLPGEGDKPIDAEVPKDAEKPNDKE